MRTISQQELVAKLEDYLFHLHEHIGAGSFPRDAAEYLDEWASEGRGWLRKYYPQGSDEAHFDLTPATEKALAWLAGLQQRQFVGTESRLLTVFELLRQIVEGTRADPQVRLAELERRQSELAAEIQRVRAGDFEIVDPAQVRDRFAQMSSTAYALLADSASLSRVSATSIGPCGRRSRPGRAAGARCSTISSASAMPSATLTGLLGHLITGRVTLDENLCCDSNLEKGDFAWTLTH